MEKTDKEILKILPEKIYIAFYRDGDGNPTRGEWKQSNEDIEEEKTRYRRAHYRWTETSTLSKESLIDMGKELNMSLAKILKSI